MKLSKQLFQDRFLIPKGWNKIETYKLFEKLGLVEFPQTGFPLFLPIGKMVLENICALIWHPYVMGLLFLWRAQSITSYLMSYKNKFTTKN